MTSCLCIPFWRAPRWRLFLKCFPLCVQRNLCYQNFSWLCWLARACVPHYNDATNEIHDLPRDPQVNILGLYEKHTFEIRTLLFAFLFLSKRVGRMLLTLQLSGSVPWSGVQRTALLVPLESRASFWRFEQWRQIVQLRREECHEFPHLKCSLYVCLSISNYCFAFFWVHLDMDVHTSGQSCFWSWCDLSFGHTNLLHMNKPWVIVCAGFGISWTRSNLSEKILFSSMFHKSSVVLSSELSKLRCCLSHDISVFRRNWDDDSVGTYLCSLGVTWWR